MVHLMSGVVQSRTGIHGGVRRGAATAAIGAVLVLAAGAPAAQGDPLIPVPTVPVTPPGGLIEPPIDVVIPPDPAPTVESPGASVPGTAPAAPAAVPEPEASVPAAGPAVAPAVPDATPAAAVRRSPGTGTASESRAVEAAAQAGRVPPDDPAGAAGRLPNMVLAGLGFSLLAVAAAAGVVYLRLRGA